MNAGGVFGRVAPAWLSDKIGRFNLLCPSAFFAGLSCLVFWMFGKSLVAIIIFAALYGLLSGAFTSVVTPCVAQISDIREIGMRIGILYTFISVPCVSFRPFLSLSCISFGRVLVLLVRSLGDRSQEHWCNDNMGRTQVASHLRDRA